MNPTITSSSILELDSPGPIIHSEIDHNKRLQSSSQSKVTEFVRAKPYQ